MMMSQERFLEELQERGEPAELALLWYIKKFYPNAYKEEGYNPDYDIIDPDSGKTFEVKNQHEAFKYVVIETASAEEGRFKLTGITTSKATYWVIWCKGFFYFIRTQLLRQLVKDLPSKTMQIEDQAKTIKLLLIDDLIENADHSYEMSQEEINTFNT
jgi:hypothetical protein